MLAYREMKKFDFSFSQVCSNDCASYHHLASSFKEEIDCIECPSGYNTNIVISHAYNYSHTAAVDSIILLTWHDNTYWCYNFLEYLKLTRLVVHMEILHVFISNNVFKSIIFQIIFKFFVEFKLLQISFLK